MILPITLIPLPIFPLIPPLTSPCSSPVTPGLHSTLIDLRGFRRLLPACPSNANRLQLVSPPHSLQLQAICRHTCRREEPGQQRD